MKARPGFDPGSLVAGLIVIELGIVLLLDRTGVLDLRFDYWWPLALAAVGGVLLACGLAGPQRRDRADDHDDAENGLHRVVPAADDVARDVGMAPWQVDKARRALGGWTADALATCVRAVAAADFEVKGGGRDPVYAVERCVLTITGQHARNRD